MKARTNNNDDCSENDTSDYDFFFFQMMIAHNVLLAKYATLLLYGLNGQI